MRTLVLPFDGLRRRHRRGRQRGSRIRIEANSVAERPEIERSAGTAVIHPAPLMERFERVQRRLTGPRLVGRELSFFDFFFLDRNLVAVTDRLSFTRRINVVSKCS